MSQQDFVFPKVWLCTPSRLHASPVSVRCILGVLTSRLRRLLCQGCSCPIRNICSSKVSRSRKIGLKQLLQEHRLISGDFAAGKQDGGALYFIQDGFFGQCCHKTNRIRLCCSQQVVVIQTDINESSSICKRKSVPLKTGVHEKFLSA